MKKIIAASSASVYGEPSYLPIDEAHPFNNRTMYGAGKIATEQMLRAFHDTSGLLLRSVPSTFMAHEWT